jgi:hypothetical protein
MLSRLTLDSVIQEPDQTDYQTILSQNQPGNLQTVAMTVPECDNSTQKSVAVHCQLSNVNIIGHWREVEEIEWVSEDHFE